MRSLITVITSVLNSDEDIPGLPSDRLVAFSNCGQPIPGTIDQTSFLKIARLQTLIVQEQEKAEIPGVDALKQAAEQNHQDFASTMAASLSVKDDATSNTIMLERLIVLIVRDACPAECERFDVRYVADVSMQVFFCEIPQQRFLD